MHHGEAFSFSVDRLCSSLCLCRFPAQAVDDDAGGPAARAIRRLPHLVQVLNMPPTGGVDVSAPPVGTSARTVVELADVGNRAASANFQLALTELNAGGSIAAVAFTRGELSSFLANGAVAG